MLGMCLLGREGSTEYEIVGSGEDNGRMYVDISIDGKEVKRYYEPKDVLVKCEDAYLFNVGDK